MFIGIQVYLMDRKNHINRIFALLCLSVVCWAFVTAQLYYSIDPENARFSPEFDKNNRVISVLARSRDITDHVNAESHLREAETRYRHIFNQSTDALVHLDQRSRIVDVNDRTNELACNERMPVARRPFRVLICCYYRPSNTLAAPPTP